MKIRVKLFATLRDGRFEEDVREYAARTSVGHILEDLEIPESDVKVVFVNNRHARLDQTLKDGDVLGVFPPIGGG
jgi:molybdopterin converting factor small subunit